MDWMPHGYCFFWEPWPLYSRIVGHGLTALAYFILSFWLINACRHRWKAAWIWMPPALYMFGTFIFLCGLSHAISIITIWYPAYNTEGGLLLLTGIWSMVVAVVTIRSWPKLKRVACE